MQIFYENKQVSPHPLIRQALDIAFQYPASLLAISEDAEVPLRNNSCPAARLLHWLRVWVEKNFKDVEDLENVYIERSDIRAAAVHFERPYTYFIDAEHNNLCRNLKHANAEINRSINRYINLENTCNLAQPDDKEVETPPEFHEKPRKDARIDGPSAAAKLRVLKRDRFTCVYCGRNGQDAELQVDHIQPVANGGSHHISNLQTTCRHCNQSKGKFAAPKTKPDLPQVSQMEYSKSCIGLWLITFSSLNHQKTNPVLFGDMSDQGLIIGREDDYFLVQLFSWACGSPTYVVALKKSFVFDPGQVVMFSEKEDFEEFIRQKRLMERQQTREAS